MLFVTEAADRVVDPVFYVKMASIAVALWLGDGGEAPRRSTGRTRRRSRRSRRRSLAAASLGLWTVAIVAGRLMAYLKK